MSRRRPAFDVKAEILNIDETQRDLRTARREIRQELKTRLLDVAQHRALPEAMRRIPVRTGRFRDSLTARATQSGAYLTTKMRGGEKAGFAILEWGAYQDRTAELFMTQSVAANRREIDDGIRQAIYDSFNQPYLEVKK